MLRNTRLTAAAICALFAAACTDTEAPVDAGTPVVDAGPVDAGEPPEIDPPTPRTIGGRCELDDDCLSGHCDLGQPGGACTDACADNFDCPEGAACHRAGNGTTYCVAVCANDRDCRRAYSCKDGFQACLPRTGCHSNLDCRNQAACESSTGLCAGAIGEQRLIGDACANSSVCVQGPRPICVSQNQGFPAGYCTSACRTDAACGEGNRCIAGITGNAAFSVCLKGCAAESECRFGYVCAPVQGAQSCVPKCRKDDDCLEAGQTCEVSTGLCTGGPAPDGGTPPDLDGGGPPDLDAGEPDAGEPDLDAGEPEPWDGGFPAFPRPAPPQVVKRSGPVMAAPVFVPVFFANDDAAMIASITDFDSRVGATYFWEATTKEYGVGPGSAVPPFKLPELATGTLTDRHVQKWLETKILAGELPDPTADTLYVLHYPRAMNITLQGERSCEAFGGYHSSFTTAAGKSAIYAVIPRCLDGSGASTLDTVTDVTSHELVEAATDPLPLQRPAYITVDPAHAYWSDTLGGGETSDLCAQDPASSVQFDELPYVVQRSWSNAAALAGRDPCVPTKPGEVFFVAVPDLTESVSYASGTGSSRSTGVKIPPGGSRVVDVLLYSDADTHGPWEISVQSMQDFGGSSSPFRYQLDRTSGVNGDHLRLTVTSTSTTPSRRTDVFALISRLGDRTHWWFGLAAQ